MAMLALLLAAAASAPASAAPSRADPAAAGFDALKSLVGRWRASRPNGRVVEIVYRLTAGGTVLAETWTLGPDRESMTLYHRDGRDLLATHYCPIGNQPRLRLANADPARPRFRFKDATDVAGLGESRLHAFGLDVLGPGRILRTETYLESGKPETETLTFDRVAS